MVIFLAANACRFASGNGTMAAGTVFWVGSPEGPPPRVVSCLSRRFARSRGPADRGFAARGDRIILERDISCRPAAGNGMVGRHLGRIGFDNGMHAAANVHQIVDVALVGKHTRVALLVP